VTTIDSTASAEFLPAAMGRWAIASAPQKIRALLGSCVGVVLYDRVARLGGVAHIVLPDSRGAADHPGKYVDTAIPGMVDELGRRLGRGSIAGRLTAKVAGGASMFQADQSMNIGQKNGEAVARALDALKIPIIASDLGGDAGRRLILDTFTGIVSIRIPGGAEYNL
jgi:chemotaxis protein CheD